SAIVASAAVVGVGVASNYSITYTNGTLTVNAAALTITATDRSKTYGTTLTLGGTAFTTGGLVNGDTVTSVTLTSTGVAATAAVGSSAIVPSAAIFGVGVASNYSITYTNGTLTVNAAALTITANNKSKQYSDLLPALDATYNGFVLGQDASALGGTLNCTSTAIALSGPGTYPITCSGQTSSNYAITYKDGTLTVTQEDARVAYAGNLFVGIPLSSSSAQITLIATIQDITAVNPT